MRLAKSYSCRQIEICYTNLFDVLVLLRLHFIIITLFQTTLLQETSGYMYINSAYCMENFLAWPYKVTVLLFSVLHIDSVSLTILVPLWCIIISLVLSLCCVLFSGFLQFEGNFNLSMVKITRNTDRETLEKRAWSHPFLFRLPYPSCPIYFWALVQEWGGVLYRT